MPRKKKRPKDPGGVARRPANPKAQRSGSGFHEHSRYSKKDRRSGERSASEEADG